MTEREWALLLHLVGVVLLFSGMTVAAAASESARRRERLAEIAALLALTRTGVALLAAGALVVVGSGLWLIETSNGFYSLDDGWIAGALGLLVLGFVLGALGGQRPKQARRLAVRLVREGQESAEEPLRLLDDAPSRAFNYAATIAVTAALVIMVWKPGL